MMHGIVSEHLSTKTKRTISQRNFYDSKASLVDDPLRSEDSQRGDRKKWFRAQETVIKIFVPYFLDLK